MRKLCGFVTVGLMIAFWGLTTVLGIQLDESGVVKQLEAGVPLIDLQIQSSYIDFLQSDTGQVNSLQALVAFVVIATTWRGFSFPIRVIIYVLGMVLAGLMALVGILCLALCVCMDMPPVFLMISGLPIFTLWFWKVCMQFATECDLIFVLFHITPNLKD
jgi:hypothetical protein